jgi:hypothetical protein
MRKSGILKRGTSKQGNGEQTNKAGLSENKQCQSYLKIEDLFVEISNSGSKAGF